MLIGDIPDKMVKMKKNDLMRITANIILLIGQWLVLYHNVELGLIIKLLGSGVLITSLCLSSYKMWDVVFTLSCFTALEFSRLLVGG